MRTRGTSMDKKRTVRTRPGLCPHRPHARPTASSGRAPALPTRRRVGAPLHVVARPGRGGRRPRGLPLLAPPPGVLQRPLDLVQLAEQGLELAPAGDRLGELVGAPLQVADLAVEGPMRPIVALQLRL